MALSCPQCHALTHAERLTSLHEQLQSAIAAGKVNAQRDRLGEMRDLLPRDSTQFAAVDERLKALGPEPSALRGKLAGAGALALLGWKFKSLLLLVVTKGKFLLLGLTKLKTLLSMGAFLSVYWALWGWQFALGLVVSIYIHEMGHVAALRRLGIASSAPMFVPFVGAYVRSDSYPRSEREDAQVGLAGPIYGALAAVGCFAIYRVSGQQFFGAVAQVGAYINLFNLIPVWQLDGGRGFNALTRRQRLLVLAIVLAAFALTGSGLLLLIAAGAIYRCVSSKQPAVGHLRTLWTYCGLLVVLSSLTTISLPSLQQLSHPSPHARTAGRASPQRETELPHLERTAGSAATGSARRGPKVLSRNQGESKLL